VSFKVDQKVVYPNHGVSLVEKIEEGSIDGVEQTYYHLRLHKEGVDIDAIASVFD